MLIAQHLSSVAAQNLAKPAFRYLGKETNYNDLRSSVGKLSYLYQHDLSSGARVAFLTRNCPAFISTFFALTNIRSATIPVNPELPPDEIIAWIKGSKATHLAVTNDLVGTARDLLQSARLGIPLIEIEKKQGGEYDPSFSPPPENPPNENDVILVLRTAGNAGKPKFVNFTHKQVHHAAVSLRGIYHLLGTDRFHTTMNWAHPFAFVHGMLFPIMTGAVCVIDHGLEGVEHLDFLQESRVTRIVSTPPQLLKLLLVCKNEKRLLPGVKSVTSGLGLLAPELVKTFEKLKIGVAQVYGQTENVWTIAMEDPLPGDDKEAARPGAKSLPGCKYKVLDEKGDEITGRDSRTGMLAIMGPAVMTSYLDMEKETKSALRGTWLYTGDIATLEGDGESLRIQFQGRKEDLVSVDGRPTSTAQVGRVLKELSGVQEAAAVLVKDSKGELALVMAVVKVTGSALNEKQVIEFCGSRLPPAFLPKAVAFTDVIPRDRGGNILYARLRTQVGSAAG